MVGKVKQEVGMRTVKLWFVAVCGVAMLGVAHAELSCELGILTAATLEGNNPATGEPWQVGDQYRLVFISSTSVDPKNEAANDIAYWNDAIQAIANSATSNDLSSVSWKIIGSTESVDARDNTSTNPNVDGTGHAIFPMDGSSAFENNFEDLWDGVAPQNNVWFDENGVALDDSTAVNWPLTGSSTDGTAAGSALRNVTASGQIRQGRPAYLDGRGWINANNIGANWFSNSALSVYGMSEPLTIQGPVAGTILSIE